MNKVLDSIKKWLDCNRNPKISSSEYNLILNELRKLILSNRLFRSNKFSIEDVIQDVWIKLQTKRCNIDIEGFYSYSKTVIANHLNDLIKRELRFGVEIQDEILRTHHLDSVDISLLTDLDKIGEKKLRKYENPVFQRLARWNNWEKSLDSNIDLTVKPTFGLNKLINLDQSGYNFFYSPNSRLIRYKNWLNSKEEYDVFMEMAIKEMKKSISENRSKIDPMVGAVLIDKKGEVLATAYRGQVEEKGHCEYNLLENLLDDKFVLRRYQVPKGQTGEGAKVTELNLRGATLFVTLEPCSSRSHTKCSCADRIIYSRGISTVYIGLRDPDLDIDGGGIQKLKKAGIDVRPFPINMMIQIINAKNNFDYSKRNRDFILSKNKFYLDNQPEIVNILLST